jgi:hypothetical protein
MSRKGDRMSLVDIASKQRNPNSRKQFKLWIKAAGNFLEFLV